MPQHRFVWWNGWGGAWSQSKWELDGLTVQEYLRRAAVTLEEPWYTKKFYSVEVDQEILFVNHYTSSISIYCSPYLMLYESFISLLPFVGSLVQLHPLTHAQFVSKAYCAETKFEKGASDRNSPPVLVQPSYTLFTQIRPKAMPRACLATLDTLTSE